MINKVLSKFVGTKHERDVKRMRPMVEAISELEPEVQALSDEELRAKTDEFRRQLKDGSGLDELLAPAFAVVREAARRAVSMRPFDEQLMGGVVLHQGKVAEMKTGEGKTLVATMPVYLRALEGKGVHVVTVNDYLARRDAEWMGSVYRFLGMTVGCIQNDLPPEQRREAYEADITYGTNNEFGFDYLRDNMKLSVDDAVQRGFHYAIVDEVDSILVDEARTPLIISGPSDESIDKYYRIDKIVPRLERGEEIDQGDGRKSVSGHFLVDEKAHTVALTDEGVSRVEELLDVDNLYDMENVELIHGVDQALRAHYLYKRDVDYLIKDKQVVIVDPFTGRMMPGRRWSDGLHQAVEAKEHKAGVRIESENQTLATITFQNYFRMYDTLAGMTGTAETEATELGEIYDLDVVVLPTHEDMVRKDHDDLIFRTEEEKWEAVVEEIATANKNGQPALVGTISIENSEKLAKLLDRKGIRHVVLNAKFHEREATIVAQAGRKGAVTIATNMAGRGTDIVLGGSPEALARSEADPEKEPEAYEEALARYRETSAAERAEVLEAGGLYIIGTERHESRRIDNQLRGRSGRQGDHGASRFFLSLEDDLMRVFGTDRIQGLLGRIGMQPGEPIEHKMVSKGIERAQRQVEGRNFEARKNLLEYDDVMNKQRQEIYQLRSDVQAGRDVGSDYVLEMAERLVDRVVDDHNPDLPVHLDPETGRPIDPETGEPVADWFTALKAMMVKHFKLNLEAELEELGTEELRETLHELVHRTYESRESTNGEERMRRFERHVMLRALDHAWKEHLLALDHLKEGIGLRGYGQRDPKNEYKRESYELFGRMRAVLEEGITERLFTSEVPSLEHLEAIENIQRGKADAKDYQYVSGAMRRPKTIRRTSPKVRVNDPCPCGSGKKYKKCHGSRSGVAA